MKFYTTIFFFLLFFSCDVSFVSIKNAKDISKIKVSIYIEDGVKDKSLDHIMVKLSDGKKQIINKGIRILLNSEPLELFIKEELYYTKLSYYKSNNLLRKDSYYFEIILPDNTKYPLAFIKPITEIEKTKFLIPEKIFRNENFSIEWENEKSTSQIEIWKLVHLKTNVNEHSGGRYAKSTIIDTLRTKQGNYIVPSSYYEDSLSIADYLKVRLDHQEKGLINPKLLKNSEITYNYTFEKTINIIEE